MCSRAFDLSVLPIHVARVPAAPFARCPHSLIASLATLPSMSLIPFAPFASRQPRQDASLRLFDLRQNAFHLFFAEGAQRLSLRVTERAVL
jgi:hypothetical protein